MPTSWITRPCITTPNGWPSRLPYFGIGLGNQKGFVGAGDGTAFILDNSSLYHLTPAAARQVPGGYVNNGFVGAGDGTAYLLDGTTVRRITPAGETPIHSFGTSANGGFVGAGNGEAFIVDGNNDKLFHFDASGASDLGGAFSSANGFVGAGDGEAFLLDGTTPILPDSPHYRGPGTIMVS